MRLEDIIGPLQRYFILASAGVAVLAVLCLMAYFIVYKKWMKGTKRPRVGQVILWAMLVGYVLMVICLTLLSREASFDGNMNLHFLSSWRDAWNTGRLRSWQLLIFNILMLVPLGILLPLCVGSLRSEKAISGVRPLLDGILTIGSGFLFTLCIESAQLFLGWGVFELDDMFYNTLGTLLGYCIVMTGINLWGKKALLYFLPVVLIVSVFAGAAVKYQTNEYGNLNDYTYRQNMDDVTIQLSATLSESPSQAMVYKIRSMKRDEAMDFAKEFYGRLGVDADNVIMDTAYNDNAIIKVNAAEGRDYLLWLYYDGGHYNFTDFDAKYPEEDGDQAETTGRNESAAETVTESGEVTEEQVRLALSGVGITIPADAVYQERDGKHFFREDGYLDGDKMIRGEVSCEIIREKTAAGEVKNTIATIRNNMMTYYKYKEAPLISEREAYENLVAGKFTFYMGEDLKSMDIESVEQGYSLDTKGFYQPVYLFHTRINETQTWDLMVPALS